MIARNVIRQIGLQFKAEAADRDPDALVSITARDAEAVGEILTNQPWFTANELRVVAGAMDILHYAKADGWTMRERLDEFWTEARRSEQANVDAAFADEKNANFTAGAFAAFLNGRATK